METSPVRNKNSVSPREASRDKARKRRSPSRDKRRKSNSRSRSASRSPNFRGGGGYRGQRNRFNRRSPFRGGGRNFRDRNFYGRNSRSRSPARRFIRNRRSRSESPIRQNTNNYVQQAPPPAPMYSDGYGNFMPNAPAAPQFGSMAMAPQYNTNYDFQAPSYPPPAPTFNSMGIACPAPPGMSDGWIAPPAMSSAPPNIQNEESESDKLKREAAVAEEKKRQRENLKKQRDQYVQRSDKMKNELKVLKQQKSNLMNGLGKRSPSPKTGAFLKENDKLQSQISSKLSENLNVIDMLTGIIGKDADEDTPKKGKSSKKSKKSESDSSPERIKNEVLESMKRKKREADEKKQKFNYIVYDPEQHWCKTCQVFPKTAKDYLNHLHSKEHAEKVVKNQTDSTPWRESFMKANEIPSYPDAPKKKQPIKGLQFFEPATAWWCKLCDMFMGDLQCASHHLKSEIHAEKYAKLLLTDPEFETKWNEAREKALGLTHTDQNGKSSTAEKSSKDDKKSKKKKNKRDDRKDKKKRKSGKKRKHGSSSSSSTDSDGSDSSSESESSVKKSGEMNSIRVAMRNFLSGKSVPYDERSGKWTKVSDKPNPPPAPSMGNKSSRDKKKEPALGQWTIIEPIISSQEKQLLENLKGRLKNQQKTDVKDSGDIKKDNDKNMSRERSKEKIRVERNYRGRRSRSRSNSRNRRSRSNSRQWNRRSRSNSRNRSYGRYSRRYSRDSRSRSRGRRVEKPRVNFPPEPRLPPVREKLPARSYTSSKKDESKKDESSSSSNNAKKMPFIGKMPVFKKQLSDKKSEELAEEERKNEEPAVEPSNDEKQTKEDTWANDMMPDPFQYSAIMGAPPPPPMLEEPTEILPPGIDESESEFMPKPISDAPVPRKGPLPEDFQATLDLLFDGDTPKPVVIEAPKPVPEVPVIDTPMPNEDGPQMIMAEELSQHALLYGNFYGQSSETQVSNDAQNSEPSKSSITEMEIEDNKNDNDTEGSNKQDMDLDDLALLGIDVNDVGSGMW